MWSLIFTIFNQSASRIYILANLGGFSHYWLFFVIYVINIAKYTTNNEKISQKQPIVLKKSVKYKIAILRPRVLKWNFGTFGDILLSDPQIIVIEHVTHLEFRPC